MPEYVLYDLDIHQDIIINLYAEDANAENDSYTVHLGNINYKLQDISAPIGIVIDANNQSVFMIDWHEDTIRQIDQTYGTDETDDETDGTDATEEESWDDEPTPIPGHYGPDPDNLPSPINLFQTEPLESDGPTLDDQIVDYDPATDTGRVLIYERTYEIRNVSHMHPAIFYNGMVVGFFQDGIPHFY